jgi:hypothetical protein
MWLCRDMHFPSLYTLYSPTCNRAEISKRYINMLNMKCGIWGNIAVCVCVCECVCVCLCAYICMCVYIACICYIYVSLTVSPSPQPCWNCLQSADSAAGRRVLGPQRLEVCRHITTYVIEYEIIFTHYCMCVFSSAHAHTHTQAHAHISVKYAYHFHARKLIKRTSNSCQYFSCTLDICWDFFCSI